MVKNMPANAVDIRDACSIPGSGRSPGGGKCNPLQYSCLGNSMDRGAWQLQSMGSQRVGHEGSSLAHSHVGTGLGIEADRVRVRENAHHGELCDLPGETT